MAKYRLVDTEGVEHIVEGPEGATNEQIAYSFLLKQQEKTKKEAETGTYLDYLREEAKRISQMPDEEPDTDNWFEDIYKGVGAGFVQGIETAALGAITPLGEEDELSARDVIKSVADAVRPKLANPEGVISKLSQGIGSFASLAPALLTGPAAPATVIAMAGSMGVGEASERARAAGATQSERNQAAALGIFPGLLDVIPFARVSRRAAPVLNDLFAKLGPQQLKGWKSRIQRAAVTGGIEGAQETAQGLLQNAIEKGVYRPDRGIITGDAFEEGAVGFGAGAIIQGLLDAFVGFGRRGPTPSDVQQEDDRKAPPWPIDETRSWPQPPIPPPQGELFDRRTDLGTLPPVLDAGQTDLGTTPIQTELFPREDLGIAPERPDDRQLDLFADRTIEPEGEQLTFRDEEIRRANTPEAIREREALAAIERGDEAAFAQPDLFPEDAATARTVAEETAALRRIGQEATPETTPVTEVRDPRQTDLVDAVKTAEFLEAEENTLRDMEAQDAAIRAESDLETIRGQLGTQQEQATTVNRGAVLDSVLTDIGTASRANVAQRFSQALANAGIANTAPTAAELRAINRATDVVAATRTEAEVPQGELFDRETDLGTTPIQTELFPREDLGIAPERPDNRQLDLFPEASPTIPTRQEDRARRAAEREATDRGLTASATTDVEVPDARPDQLELFDEPLPPAEAILRGDRESVQGTVDERPDAPSGDTADTTPFTPAGLDTTAAGARGAAGGTRQQPGKLKGAISDVVKDLENVTKGVQPVPAKRERKPAKKTTTRKTTRKTTTKKSEPRTEEQFMQDIAADEELTSGEPKGAVHQIIQEDTYLDDNKNVVRVIPKGVKGRGKSARKKKSSSGTVVTSREGPEPTPEQLKEMETAAAGARAARGELEGEGVDFFISETKEEVRVIQASKDDADKIINLLKNPPKISRLVELTGPIDKRELVRDAEGNYIIKGKKTGEAKTTTEFRDVITYFSKFKNPIDALEVMAYDAVLSPKIFQPGIKKDQKDTFTAAELEFLPKTGSTAANSALNWVANNLDENTVTQLGELMVSHRRSLISEQASLQPSALDPVAEKRRVDAAQAISDAETAKNYATDFIVPAGKRLQEVIGPILEDVDFLPDYQALTAEVVSLDIPVHPLVDSLLRSNRLREALKALAATSPSNRVSQVARKLLQKIGDTKVEIVENLKDESGVRLAGSFDPKTNTIKIDAATGINAHTILHEVTHALTSATLTNKSHPVTRQLEKLFNEVKDQLNSVYGAQNIDEFVAEAFGNPEFQQTLSGIIPKRQYAKDGRPINALERFLNTISNFVRSMLGMQTKPIDSVMNQADQLIEAMLAPAPQHRDAAILRRITAEDMITGLDRVSKAIPGLTPKFRKDFVASVVEFFSGKATSGVSKRTLSRFAPLQALADISGHYGLKSAQKLHDAIQRMVGAQSIAEDMVDSTYTKMQGWLKKLPDDKRLAFNNLVYTSTTEQVDPYKSQPKPYKLQFVRADGKTARISFATKSARDAYKRNLKPTDSNIRESENAAEIKKANVWKEMQRDVNKIGEGGKSVYIELRNTYAKQFKDLQEVIIGRINTLTDSDGNLVDEKQREKLTKNVFNKIFEKGRIEPYFPLTRQGDKWLEFNTKTAEGTIEPVYMAFKTNVERTAFIKGIKDADNVESGSIREFSNIEEALGKMRNAPAGSFVNQTLDILTKNKVSTDVQNQFLELFLNALPESSFAKSLTRRGNEGAGKLGFDEDAEGAFRQKAYNMASQIERMRHAKNIDDVMGELREQQKAISQASKKDTETVNQLFNELQSRAEFAKQPPSDKRAANFNRIAFMGTIGLNASSAVVNMSQIPLMMYPILSGEYGITESTKAIGRAVRLIGRSAIGRRGTTVLGENVKTKGMPSIDNFYKMDADGNFSVRDDIELDSKLELETLNLTKRELEDMIPLIKRAAEHAQLNKSIFYDTLGTQLSGREKTPWDFANAYSAFMFHQVERYNRQVAMTTVYQLELDRLRSKKSNKTTIEERGMSDADMKEAAARKAIYKAQEMNGGAFLATAPSIAQKGVGRVAMMYKSFGLQMYYTILKTGRQAFKVDLVANLEKEGVPKGIAKTMGQTAFKQFAGIMGSSVALAGVSGLPFIGIFMGLYDTFFRDDDEEYIGDTIRKSIGEGWYKGAINYTTGVDVSNRFGLGNLLFRLNPYSQNQSATEIAAQMVGGPAYSVGSQFVKGLSMANDGELWRGTEMMMPSAIRNVMKGYRYMSEGTALTKRHDPIIDNITFGEALTQMFGFAPTKYTLQQEKNLSTKRIEKAIVKEHSKLLKRFYIAARMGDTDEVRDILEDINKFNAKHPAAAISSDNIYDSIRSHIKTSSEMIGGVTINPKLRAELIEHQSEYWGM